LNADILYHLPEFLNYVWSQCASLDGRVTFGCGFAAAVVSGRVLSLFTHPFQKVAALFGAVLIALLALAFWVGFAGSLQPGTVPFHKATETPNAGTLLEIQK
jgi:Zn-dependent protease